MRCLDEDFIKIKRVVTDDLGLKPPAILQMYDILNVNVFHQLMFL